MGMQALTSRPPRRMPIGRSLSREVLWMLDLQEPEVQTCHIRTGPIFFVVIQALLNHDKVREMSSRRRRIEAQECLLKIENEGRYSIGC
jgi:hypothetical protein